MAELSLREMVSGLQVEIKWQYHLHIGLVECHVGVGYQQYIG